MRDTSTRRGAVEGETASVNEYWIIEDLVFVDEMAASGAHGKRKES